MVDAHRFQTVTHRSWLGRLGDALKGIIVGLILLVVAVGLLFWNEGRTVRRYRTLVQGAGAVVSVQPDPVDLANEGRLVHVSGGAAVDGPIADPELHINAEALRLDRDVEMFQWREKRESEERKKTGGGTETVTTYDYSRTWSSRVIDSGRFEHPDGHRNPTSMPVPSRTFTADPVRLGAFVLSVDQVERLGSSQPLPLPPDTVVPPSLGDRARVYNGGFQVGDPATPEIGDLRIAYSVVRPGPVSVVARQVGSSFAPYVMEGGGSIDLLDAGTSSAAAMFDAAQSANTVLTWVLRAVGALIMFLGFGLILRPLSVAADVIPLLGNLVGVGVGLIAFLLAAAGSAVTVGIAWLFYRPLLGGTLLAVAVVLLVLVVRRLRGGKAATTAG